MANGFRYPEARVAGPIRSRATSIGRARSVARFFEVEAAGGILLLAATAAALLWANSPVADSYEELSEEVRPWVNDGLMVLFFFVVGLEIKREVVSGQLSTARAAALPVVAAVGGMVVPAAIYLLLNPTAPTRDGWGIPMATDIAFAVGVLTLLGPRVPPALKVLLLALAVVDDIGAIVVIAVAYTDDLSAGWLGLAGLGLAAAAVLRRAGVWFLPLFVVIGLFVWLATLESGIHPTIAGVALGVLVPERARSIRRRRTVPVAERLEDALHPWVSYGVVPLFALANAGIPLSAESIADAAASTVTAGVVAGLVVGKVAGILGASAVAIRLGIGRLPAGIGWRHLAGLSALAGIGFTVSIFVTGLAFEGQSLQDEAKVGVLVASVVAASIGAAILLAGQPASDAAVSTRKSASSE